MKKMIALLVILLMLGGCAGNRPGIQTLKADEIIAKYENQESFMLFTGQGDCTFCGEYTETLKLICEDYQLNIYYFDYHEIEENEESVRHLINDYLYQLVWMPTTYFVIDGKTVNIISEKMDYTQVKEWLQEYGIIDQ